MLVCACCGKAGPPRPCNKGCGIAAYCDRRCQKFHYRDHKAECQEALQAGKKAVKDETLEAPDRLDFDPLASFIEPPAPTVQGPDLMFKWSKVRAWYNQPMVLHYDQDSSASLEFSTFVGVYRPILTFSISWAMEFDPVATAELYRSYQVFPSKEKAYRIDHGFSLNEGRYWHPSYEPNPSPIEMWLCNDLSIKATSNDGKNQILVRVPKHPPSSTLKLMDQSLSKEETRAILEKSFDEWRLIDRNSKVLGTASVALTPLTLFAAPIFTDQLSTREWLCQEDALVLWSEKRQTSNQGTPPQDWLNSISGVYGKIEGYVYGNLKGRHIGWRRDPQASQVLFGKTSQYQSHVVPDRDLCLYSCEISDQFVIRPFLEDGSVREDIRPELASPMLQSREAIHLQSLSWNWSGYLPGDGEWTVPMLLYPMSSIMEMTSPATRTRSVQSTSLMGGHVVDSQDLSRGGQNVEAGPVPVVVSKKKRKKKKKKGGAASVKRFVEAAADLGSAIPPDPYQETKQVDESPSDIGKGEDLNDCLTHTAKSETGLKSLPLGVDAAVVASNGQSTRVSVQPPLPVSTNPDASKLRAMKDENESDEVSKKDKLEFRRHSHAMDHKKSITKICNWLANEIASKPTSIPRDDLAFLGFVKTPSFLTIGQWLFDPHPTDYDEPLWIQASESTTSVVLEKFLHSDDRLHDELGTNNAWLHQKGTSLLFECVDRGRMKDSLALIGSREAVPILTAPIVCRLFGKLRTAKGGTKVANALARKITEVKLSSMSESEEVEKCATGKLSKDAFAALRAALRQGMKRLRDAEKVDPTTSIMGICNWLRDEIKSKPTSFPSNDLSVLGFDGAPSMSEVVQWVFDPRPSDYDVPPWVYAPDSLTAVLLKNVLHPVAHLRDDIEATSRWLHQNGALLLEISVESGRMNDVIVLIGCREAVPFLTASMVCRIFGKLGTARKGGTELGNTVAKNIVRVQLDSMSDSKEVLKCAASKLSKKANDSLKNALRKGEKDLQKRQNEAKRRQPPNPIPSSIGIASESNEKANSGTTKIEAEKASAAHRTVENVSEYRQRIDISVKWYADELGRICKIGIDADTEHEMNPEQSSAQFSESHHASLSRTKLSSKSIVKTLTSDQIATAISECSNLPEEEAEEVLSGLEMSLDLSQWSVASTWIVEITEQAHRWFRKRSKKQHHMCERVLRRMQLLSTGRWPYVFCKPVRSSKKASINLYESKIDTSSRILWEVAVSFSRRLSREGRFFSEQVIRVWDIVEDHDNLSHAIDRAVQRVEKSHIRGKECMIFSQLEGFDANVIQQPGAESKNDCLAQRIPKVFRMQEASRGPEQPNEGAHYAPANDDEKQFNLLKFYEMDEEAVSLLLSDDADTTDLPFTPGPLEHEIIQYCPNPKRSILLMGRSGTGKTTCLVFRMWAEYMATKERQPRQLFLTKNDVLRTEVEKSFNSMGLAWRNRGVRETGNGLEQTSPIPDGSNDAATGGNPEFPLFLTSSEWLDILDNELPGERFFTADEMQHRLASRGEDDAVQRGMEEFFGNEKGPNSAESSSARKEMTFGRFCQNWPKISSSLKTTLAPALVWLEIKSHIKGSVGALNLGNEHRSKINRFLSRDEYLSLPRKQSRINQRLRSEVYELYLKYEKLKARKYYDEMDIVHNLANRIPPRAELLARARHLFPVDAVFVDEVQDFTQSELFLVAKLCNDPNSLMLAGDTAQSIAVGVGFRFTDVRQIFFGSFGGITPKLLQLTHNYRSHSGILQLAASVVELLYHFFGSSLDRLPPDFGLFPGPKPVLMQVSSMSDLVLMLDGSKRETSRIEFGAHQVVIVRNEEAKASLPEEFGVDKDWVMTVQESKGLEFDDVLLLNFFGDSPAGDSWRIVSNYSEEDARRYRDSCKTSSTQLQSFDWAEIESQHQTRHLAFDEESHKILETELKMLYTAITRARVNVFIAEMDESTCQPMFNYFIQRGLVESVQKGSSGELAGVRVFGQINTVEEWRKRGQYYLEKSSGQKENIGALCLAAKCFEKAGEKKKMRHALAYVEFIKLEEREAEAVGKRRQQGAEKKERLYRIAADLLEAEDVEFLAKAGLCLMRTGPTEYARSARILEIHARLRHAARLTKEQRGDRRPSHLERQHYSYASQLYLRCAETERNTKEKRSMILSAFRCCISSGREDDLDQAARLLESYSEHCRTVFVDLVSIWHGQDNESLNPSTDRLSSLQRESEGFGKLSKAMTKVAFIAGRSFHANGDEKGLAAAISVVPSREDRIRLLSSLDKNTDFFERNVPWSSDHPAFCDNDDKNTETAVSKQADSTELLCEELISGGELEAAADVLESRGRLLEAAGCLSKISGTAKMDRIFHCKVLYAELILGSRRGSPQQDYTYSHAALLDPLQKAFDEAGSSLSLDDRMAFVVAKAKYLGRDEDFNLMLEMSIDSPILWKLDSFRLVMETNRVVDEFIDGNGIWARHLSVLSMSSDLVDLVQALRHGSQDRLSSIAQVYSFFQLRPCASDPRSLLTNIVTNWRLRLAFQIVNEKLPTTPVHSNSLTVAVEKSNVNSVLACYLCDLGFKVLEKFEAFLGVETLKFEECTFLRCGVSCNCGNQHPSGSKGMAVTNYADNLQSKISCLKEMGRLVELGMKCCNQNMNVLWGNRRKIANEKQQGCTAQLAKAIHSFVDVPVLQVGDVERQPKCGSIILREKATASLLIKHSLNHWYRLSREIKKSCFVETMKLWMILDICHGDSKECIELLDIKLKVAEDLRAAQKDFCSRKMGFFIRNKTKVVQGKVKKVQLLFRQWMWAVQSAHENVLESISLTENLLNVSFDRWFLKSLPKSYQLSLLETNCAALISLISYRYNDVLSGNLWLALPERRYLEFHKLQGCKNQRTPGRSFGIRLADALECIATDDLFFNFFERFVTHLETLASLVLKFDLLACPNPATPSAASIADIHCIERGIVLCSCIISNSMALAKAGKVMGKRDVVDDPNPLPRLPLGGKIHEIAMYLRDKLVHLKRLPFFQDLLRDVHKSSSLTDLFQATQQILEQELSDQYAIFRVEHNEEALANVRTTETDANQWFLQVCRAFEGRGTAPKSSDDFSFVLGNDPLPCQEFLPMDLVQLKEEARDSEMEKMHELSIQQDAASTIQRRFRRRWTDSKEVYYFRVWKMRMKRFVRVSKERIASRHRKAQTSQQCLEEELVKNPLDSFPNLYGDFNAVESGKAIWHKWLKDNMPFFDGAQCEFCNYIFEPNIVNARHRWWEFHRKSNDWLSYKEAAQRFNLENFQMQWLNSDALNHHLHTEGHIYFRDLVFHFLEVLPSLYTRIEISTRMLKAALDACRKEIDRGGTDTSWYLICEEESRSQLDEMDELLKEMQGYYRNKQFEELNSKIPMLRERSFTPQAFLEEKRKKEAEMRQLEADDQEEEEDSDDSDADSYNLSALIGSHSRKGSVF